MAKIKLNIEMYKDIAEARKYAAVECFNKPLLRIGDYGGIETSGYLSNTQPNLVEQERMTDKPFISLTKHMLRMACDKLEGLAKLAAIHEIKMQPFYGDYFAGLKCNDKIKIRRPGPITSFAPGTRLHHKPPKEQTMDMNKLYQEVARLASERSVDGYKDDPAQTGQACRAFMDIVKKHTGLDINPLLSGYPKEL